MRFLGLVAILFSFSGYAAPEDCVDLSFKSPLGGGSVEWRQVDCEKFHLTFLDPDGNPYSERDTFFSEFFHTDSINDEYELFTNRQRWMWSRDGKTLIHEATIDSLNKSTQVKTLNTFSELITLTNDGKVQRDITHVVRVEQPDGSVHVEAKQKVDVYEKI